MIKIYIFVTGLALYQFSADGSFPARALLASGGYDHPGLGSICPHVLDVEIGPQADTFPNPPTYLRFTVPNTASITAPPEVPKIDRLVNNAKVLSRCTGSDHRQVCLLPNSQPAAHSLLEFVGAWRAVGLSDCGKSYPHCFERGIEFDFVRALRSWELKGPAQPLANSVLFVADVSSLTDLTVSDSTLGNQLKLKVGTPAECRELPGFAESFATQCVMMVLRNGPAGEIVGGGDLHFASLYLFLETPPRPEDAWLPIKVDGNVCEGGGGTGGLTRCVGGSVTQ